MAAGSAALTDLPYRIPRKTITANYTVKPSDEGFLLIVDSASTVTLTYGTRLSPGFNNMILRKGAGAVNIANDGTLHGSSSVESQNDIVAVVKPLAGVYHALGGSSVGADLEAIEALSGTSGLLAKTAANTWALRTLTGTTNETLITNGTGAGGNPTVGLASNPVLPGTASVTLPKGTTAQRAVSPAGGDARFNTTDNRLEWHNGTAWQRPFIEGRQTLWIPPRLWNQTTTQPGGGPATTETNAGVAGNLNILRFSFADGSSGASDIDYETYTHKFPKRWDGGTLTFRAFGFVSGTSTNPYKLFLQAVAIGAGESYAQAFGTAVGVTLTPNGTTLTRSVSSESAALTIANSPSAEKEIVFQLYRDPVGDAGDTLAGTIFCTGIEVFWTANAGNDA